MIMFLYKLLVNPDKLHGPVHLEIRKIKYSTLTSSDTRHIISTAVVN